MVRNPHYRRNSGPSPIGPTGRRQFCVPNGKLPRRFKRLRLTVLGAGDVGARLIAQLSQRFGQSIAILAITRREEQAAKLRALGARVLALDLDQPNGQRHDSLLHQGLRRLGAFSQRLINLAPPPPSGPNDPRTRNMLSVLASAAARRHNISIPSGGLRLTPQPCWVYASTTGVYGDVQGASIDETRTIKPNSDRARRRAAAEKLWRAAGKAGAARTVIVRVPGIYAADRLPVDRLNKGLPALRAEDDVYTNHINAEDLARILWLATMRGRTNRIYHAVDDSDLKMGDYFEQVADCLNLPRPPRLSRAEVAERVSPAMLSFMQESRRLQNRRMRQELRIRLVFPTVADTLREAGRIRPGPE